MKEPGKHPTCAAVLILLEQATGLLKSRLGSEAGEQVPKPEILATAVGYCFEAMRGKSGPFSHADARDLVQKAFIAGFHTGENYEVEKLNQQRKIYQEKLNGEASDLLPRRSARGNGRAKSIRSNRRSI